MLTLGCLMATAGAAPAASAQTQPVEAWSYYASAPFQLGALSDTGLSSDLVGYLNRALAGKYRVRLVLLPRARLNMMLARGDRAFVAFAPSVIFGGLTGGHLWTCPLFADRQELISRREAPFDYRGPASLAGKDFSGMLGHIYPLLQKQIDDGSIQVYRANSEGSLLSMLTARHTDIVTLSNATVRYFMRLDPALRDKLYLSPANLGEFTRRLMFQRGMERERDDFNAVVRAMAGDPAWRATLAKYGLDPPAVNASDRYCENAG